MVEAERIAVEHRGAKTPPHDDISEYADAYAISAKLAACDSGNPYSANDVIERTMSSASVPLMPLRHPVAQSRFDFLHPLCRALEAHRAAQLLGLAAAEARRPSSRCAATAPETAARRACASESARATDAHKSTGARPLRRSRYGLTILPTIGPGRMIATSTTRS